MVVSRVFRTFDLRSYSGRLLGWVVLALAPMGARAKAVRRWPRSRPIGPSAGSVWYLWHCNRHTFCSWLAMAGATIKEIQELAGHKTITVSARYAHLSPDHKLSVLDRITAEAAKTATRPAGKTATKPQARTATKKPTATGNPNSHENSHRQEAAIQQKRP